MGKKQRRRNWSEEEVGQRSWAARRACDGGGEQTGVHFIDETRRWRRGPRWWPTGSSAVRLQWRGGSSGYMRALQSDAGFEGDGVQGHVARVDGLDAEQLDVRLGVPQLAVLGS